MTKLGRGLWLVTVPSFKECPPVHDGHRCPLGGRCRVFKHTKIPEHAENTVKTNANDIFLGLQCFKTSPQSTQSCCNTYPNVVHLEIVRSRAITWTRQRRCVRFSQVKGTTNHCGLDKQTRVAHAETLREDARCEDSHKCIVLSRGRKTEKNIFCGWEKRLPKTLLSIKHTFSPVHSICSSVTSRGLRRKKRVCHQDGDERVRGLSHA